MKEKARLFAVLVLLAVGAGWFTLGLSHDSDDEMIYGALAAKIRAAGWSGYNLRDVSIRPAGRFWKLEPEAGGDLLGLMAQSGTGYYDVPLHFNPPLFPALLAASHEIFNRTHAFLALKRGERGVSPEQLYSSLLGALFSALFLAGVYFLGKKCHDEKTALLAAFLCLSSPVFLVATFKTWSDLPAAALLVWSFVLWQEKDRPGKAVVSGVLFGLALLTRTSALFAVPIFMTKKGRAFSLWAAAALLVSGGWYFALWKEYGTPFYFPQIDRMQAGQDWLASISRPWYFYIADLLYLSPLFLAAPLSAGRKGSAVYAVWTASLLVPLSILLYGRNPLGLEDRYLLPCYPALALLAAEGLRGLGRSLPRVALALIVGAAALWSLRLGALLVAARESLKFVPW